MRQIPLPSGREPEGWRPPEFLEGLPRRVFLDTETTGLRWWSGDLPVGIAVAAEGLAPRYLPFAHRGGGNLDEGAARRWAAAELAGREIVAHNAKFDAHMLRAWGVDLEAIGARLVDTAHMAALLDDRRRKFSLDEIATDLLGREKAKGIDPERIADYHAGEIADYAERDVDLLRGIHGVMEPLISAEGLGPTMALESDVIFPVMEMERNGAPMDMATLKEWEIETARELAHLRAFEIPPFVNPESPKDLEGFGIETDERTEKGAISFADSALSKPDDFWAAQNLTPSTIKAIRRARQLASLRSKYLVPYLKTAAEEGGILRFQLHQLRADEGGTITGRFSASAFRDSHGKVGINPQQVFTVDKQRERFGEKYPIRALFVPGDGLWFSADARQIEYRIFAHFARDPEILAAYAANPELSYHELVWEMLKAVKPDIPYKGVKNINFASIYGAGKDKIAEMLGLLRSESDSFVDLYHRRFPAVRSTLQRASNTAERRGFVKTVLGRKSRFPDGERLYKALNSAIQGTAADIQKKKIAELYAERKILGITMRLTVHDELDGDTLNAETTAAILEILNRQTTPLSVPILWGLKTGRNWAECA